MFDLQILKPLHMRFALLILGVTLLWTSVFSLDPRIIAENITASHRPSTQPADTFNLVPYEPLGMGYGLEIEESPLYRWSGFGKFILPASYNQAFMGRNVALDVKVDPTIHSYLKQRHGTVIPDQVELLDYKVAFISSAALQASKALGEEFFTQNDRLVLRPQHRFFKHSVEEADQIMASGRPREEAQDFFSTGLEFYASMVGSQQGFSLVGLPQERYGATVHVNNGDGDHLELQNYVLSASGRGAGMIANFGDPTFFQRPEGVAGINDFWSIAVQLQHPDKPENLTTSVTDLHILPQALLDSAFAPIEATGQLNFSNFLAYIFPHLSYQSQVSLGLFDPAVSREDLLRKIQELDLRGRIIAQAGALGLPFNPDPQLPADQFYAQFPLFYTEEAQLFPHEFGQPLLRIQPYSERQGVKHVKAGDLVSFLTSDNRPIIIEDSWDALSRKLVLPGGVPQADLHLPFLITPQPQERVTATIPYSDQTWVNGFRRPEFQGEGLATVLVPHTAANEALYREPHWLLFSMADGRKERRAIRGTPGDSGDFYHIAYEGDSLAGFAHEAHLAPFRIEAVPVVEGEAFQIQVTSLSPDTLRPEFGFRFVSEDGSFERSIVRVAPSAQENSWTLTLSGPPVDVGNMLGEAIRNADTLQSSSPVDYTGHGYVRGLRSDDENGTTSLMIENSEANRARFAPNNLVLFGDQHPPLKISKQTSRDNFLYVELEGKLTDDGLAQFRQTNHFDVLPADAGASASS